LDAISDPLAAMFIAFAGECIDAADKGTPDTA
jgi:hypothetical protein